VVAGHMQRDLARVALGDMVTCAVVSAVTDDGCQRASIVATRLFSRRELSDEKWSHNEGGNLWAIEDAGEGLPNTLVVCNEKLLELEKSNKVLWSHRIKLLDGDWPNAIKLHLVVRKDLETDARSSAMPK